MARVLITGGAGFLGTPTAIALKERGHHVTSLDVHGNGRLTEAGVQTLEGSILDGDFVRKSLLDTQPDVILHAAAIVGVTASVGSVGRSVEVNILGSVNLFEAAADIRVSRFVDISSEETYGDFSTNPISEDDHATPLTPYGITKYAVERLGNFYADQRGLPYVAVRFCWVYGPDFPRARIPQNWIDDALAGRSSSEPFGTDQRIDFTYVDDAVAGLVAAVEVETLQFRAYNVASGSELSFSDVASAISVEVPGWSLNMGGGLLEIMPGLHAARKGALDISRARRDLGFKPSVSIEEGVRRTIESSRCRTKMSDRKGQ